jgi:hypothetical protein
VAPAARSEIAGKQDREGSQLRHLHGSTLPIKW